MSKHVHDFNAYRSRMNDRILASGNLGIKRFFNLDTAAYQDGALPAKTKELLGLCASTVLRCNDCITYHAARSAFLICARRMRCGTRRGRRRDDAAAGSTTAVLDPCQLADRSDRLRQREPDRSDR